MWTQTDTESWNTKQGMKIASVADPDPGSEIRCFFNPWIRDNFFGSRMQPVSPKLCNNFFGKIRKLFVSWLNSFSVSVIKKNFQFETKKATKQKDSSFICSLLFFMLDPWHGIRDPGSGMEKKSGYGIQDKHCGSATLKIAGNKTPSIPWVLLLFFLIFILRLQIA